MNTTPGFVDWLGQFSQSISDLTLQNGGALSNFGMLLLTFIATMILIGIAVRMSPWSAHLGGHASVSLDEVKVFLFRFLFCLVIEHYLTTNLPGASFGFNRMFSYIGAQIAQILDQNALNPVVNDDGSLIPARSVTHTAPISVPLQNCLSQASKMLIILPL